MGEALNLVLRHSEGLGSAAFFAFLLTVLVLLGLWSGLGQFPLSDILKGPSARHLFLSVQMRVAGDKVEGLAGAKKRGKDEAKGEFVGYVTELNARKTTFISPRPLSKGTKVGLDLKALPDFPEAPGSFEVQVLKSAPLRGKADSYLVQASFGELDAKLKSPLLSYLQRLTGAARLAAG